MDKRPEEVQYIQNVNELNASINSNSHTYDSMYKKHKTDLFKNGLKAS
jgi:hypothetical protein